MRAGEGSLRILKTIRRWNNGGMLMIDKIAKTMWVLFAAFGLLFAAVSTQAHHSFAAEFDSNKSLTIEGVITKVDWINPHGWWHIDVTGPDGDVEHWDIQNESPSAMRKAGITRDNIGKPGDKVKILAYGAKDGTRNLAIVRTITYESGDSKGLTFRLLSDFTK
jgi:hypothetical protein